MVDTHTQHQHTPFSTTEHPATPLSASVCFHRNWLGGLRAVGLFDHLGQFRLDGFVQFQVTVCHAGIRIGIHRKIQLAQRIQRRIAHAVKRVIDLQPVTVGVTPLSNILAPRGASCQPTWRSRQIEWQ